jgi:predicted MPP superfamily phosphohydrolase
LIVWGFFLGDWLLLALLPIAGKSFGPSKPPSLFLALLRMPAMLLPMPWSLIGQAFGTLLVVYGFWIEPHRLILTKQFLQSDKLGFDQPLRLLHLSDLHIERITGRELQLLEAVKEFSPDIILFSGDVLSFSNTDDPIAWEHAKWVLGQLSAPLGAYAVLGSPPLYRPDVIEEIYENLPFRLLQNEQVILTHEDRSFILTGISCSHQPFLDGKALNSIFAPSEDRFSILLYHTPDLAPIAAQAGIDLQLSGHTHGGQVRLPLFGALFTSSLYGKQFESGRYHINGLTLFVTRGIGMEGKAAPRVRFLCPPEITLWEIS